LASKAGRLARLRQAKARLDAEAAERARRFAQRTAASAAAAAAKGKPPPTLKPRARDEAPNPKATANVTDPDSRLLHTRKGRVQGYNAQAVTTCEQVIVAAELTQDAGDFQQLQPMLQATTATLAAAGIAERPGTLAADSGYWSIANLTQIPDAPQLLIPPPQHGRHGKPRKDGKPSASNSDGLRGDDREPHQRRRQGLLWQAQGDRRAGVRPDQGRSRREAVPAPGLAAYEAEWKLLCGTHNLLKLWWHTVIRPAATPAIA
jgi:hypothetical protein